MCLEWNWDECWAELSFPSLHVSMWREFDSGNTPGMSLSLTLFFPVIQLLSRLGKRSCGYLAQFLADYLLGSA